MHPNAIAQQMRPRSKTLGSMWAPGAAPAMGLGTTRRHRSPGGSVSITPCSTSDAWSTGRGVERGACVPEEPCGELDTPGTGRGHCAWREAGGDGHSSPALSDGSCTHTLGGISEGAEPPSDSDSDGTSGEADTVRGAEHLCS